MAIPNDIRNFMCVTVASVDLITPVLRDILDSHIPPRKLYRKIKPCLKKLKLLEEQKAICFIAPNGVPDYKQFDVSLLYKLIRNLCHLPRPAQGWGRRKWPKDKDTQISDDIERLRLFRNIYYSHRTSTKISDVVFKNIWGKLSSAISRIQSGCKADYKAELTRIEQFKFEPSDWEKCMKILDALADKPDITIKGKNEIICGGKAQFTADVKNVESSCWSITWQRHRKNNIKRIDTNRKKYSGSTKRKLVINDVCKEDEGKYKVVLSLESNGPVYKSRNSIRLYAVGGIPSVKLLEVSPVIYGSETTIKSEISSTPTPEKIKWQKSENGVDFKKIEKANYETLVIKNATFTEKGYYRLLVWNKIGKGVSNTMYLNITGSLPNVKIISKTDVKNKSLQLIGDVIVYDDSPEMQYFFWSKKKKGEDFEKIGGNLPKIRTDNPSLNITNVGPDDAGEYQLTAINAVGSNTSETIILGAPKVCEEKTEVEINGGQWITVTIKSIPAPYHVQWSKRKKEEDTFLPIDINAKEYKGTTVSFPHPVLFVKQKDQLENNCFRIEVKNFIGKTELDISGDDTTKQRKKGDDTTKQRKKDCVENSIYSDGGENLKFTILCSSIAKLFPTEKLELLKFLIKNSGKLKNLTSLEAAKSVLGCIEILQDEQLFTRKDVIFMQFLCQEADCLELFKKCKDYAEDQKALCYFKKDLAVNGYKEVKFHVQGDVSSYNKGYIHHVIKTVAVILNCTDEDIMLNGVRHSGSFILSLSVKEVYFGKLLDLKEKDHIMLRRLNIDYLIIDGESIHLERSKEEITTQRDMLSTSDNFLSVFMSTVLPIAENPSTLYTTNDHHSIQKRSKNLIENVHLRASSPLPVPIRKRRSSSTLSSFTSESKFYKPAIGSERIDPQMSKNLIGNVHLHARSPLPEPIKKGRTRSTSSSFTSDSEFYQRALGSEKEDTQMSKNLIENVHLHARSPLSEPIWKGGSNSTSGIFTSDSEFYQRGIWSRMEDPEMSENVIGNVHYHASSPLPEPISKGGFSSTSNSFTSDSEFYQRAIGSEKEDTRMVSMKLHQQLQSIDSDQTTGIVEKEIRKQELLVLPNLTVLTSTTSSLSPVAIQQPLVSTMSPAFYIPGYTVGSVVGHALKELNPDDIDIDSIDSELCEDEVNSLRSSLSPGSPTSGFGALPTGIPIEIPVGIQRGSIGSLSQSPPSPASRASSTLY